MTARAGLVLTSAATADGFSLSTFADGFPNTNGVGPLGIAFTPGGGVMVADAPGNVRVFATDTDGQNAGSATVAQNYGFGNAVGLAELNGNFYMSQQTVGQIVQVNFDGTFNRFIVDGIPLATGLIADPHTGQLFVSSIQADAIYSVDPLAGTKTLLANAAVDGLALSADGSTLYAAADGGSLDRHILGFNTTTRTLLYDSGAISGGIDGSALGTGSLEGNIFVNTNGGTVVEVNLATNAQTLIATGGSRGDFVTVDPNNGTLLLTQTDSILRLTAPPGGGFGAVPEPSSLTLFALGGLPLLAYKRRKKPV